MHNRNYVSELPVQIHPCSKTQIGSHHSFEKRKPPLAAEGMEPAWPLLDCANPRAVVTLTRTGVGPWPKCPGLELYPGVGLPGV